MLLGKVTISRFHTSSLQDLNDKTVSEIKTMKCFYFNDRIIVTQ